MVSQVSSTTSAISLVFVTVGLDTRLGPFSATFKADWVLSFLSDFGLESCTVDFRFSGKMEVGRQNSIGSAASVSRSR